VAEERLWAPWRLDYIRGPGPDECIFCRAVAGAEGGDEANLVVHRGEHCVLIMNAFPYTSGHAMIAPYVHVPSIEELDPPALTEIMTLSQRVLAALRHNYRPEGFNLGVNQGKAAGAGIEDHVHLHLVPRWGGDTNFMSAVAGTRVLPQTLEDSWAELRERFAEAGE